MFLLLPSVMEQNVTIQFIQTPFVKECWPVNDFFTYILANKLAKSINLSSYFHIKATHKSSKSRQHSYNYLEAKRTIS